LRASEIFLAITCQSSDLLAPTLQPDCCFVFFRPADLDQMKPQAPGSTQTFVIFGNQKPVNEKIGTL
jgi:hypothetical protein